MKRKKVGDRRCVKKEPKKSKSTQCDTEERKIRKIEKKKCRGKNLGQRG